MPAMKSRMRLRSLPSMRPSAIEFSPTVHYTLQHAARCPKAAQPPATARLRVRETSLSGIVQTRAALPYGYIGATSTDLSGRGDRQGVGKGERCDAGVEAHTSACGPASHKRLRLGRFQLLCAGPLRPFNARAMRCTNAGVVVGLAMVVLPAVAYAGSPSGARNFQASD